MVSLGFEQRDRRTAHQIVRDTLRRAILDGSLEGGTRLVQAEIAEQLQVSTTPVREALRDLATEGLVQLDAHRGAVVYEASAKDLDEIYELRRLLEPAAVRKAARNLTEEQFVELEQLQADMDGEEDPVRWTELNRSFHRLISAASGSRRLATTLHRLEDAAAVYVGVTLRTTETRLDSANHQHRALLEALRRGDGDAAEHVIIEHLNHTLAVVEANQPLPPDVAAGPQASATMTGQ